MHHPARRCISLVPTALLGTRTSKRCHRRTARPKRQEKQMSCYVCKGNHYVDLCSRFLAMTPDNGGRLSKSNGGVFRVRSVEKAILRLTAHVGNCAERNVTSQAKTFRTLSRSPADAVRTPRANHSKKFIISSNCSSYAFDKTHQPFERLELSVGENSSAV